MAPEEPAAALSMRLRVACALLVALAAVMPFEVPLFHVGPLLITTVELVLYATLAAWGLAIVPDFLRGRLAWRAAARALHGDWTVPAAVSWSAVTFASALTAPSSRVAAIKFALRSLSGVLVFFAARSLVRAPETARRVLFALVGGAVVSAGTAVVEWLVPGSAPAWRPFREGTFDALGLERPSGVFGYPTIGAMYWEAIVPLLVVAPLLGPRKVGERAVLRLTGLMTASVLLVGAILLSATRSGLVGVVVACAALFVMTWRTEPRAARFASLVLGVTICLSAVVLNASRFGSLLGQRLKWWQDENWFHVEYVLGAVPSTVPVGERFAVPVALRNTGRIIWRRTGDHPTHLSYHWVRLDDDSSLPRPTGASQIGEFEGTRTPLPSDVPPGASCQVTAIARGPSAAGAYRLRWDLVEEGVTWFADQGNPTPEQRVNVTEVGEAGFSLSGEVLPVASPPSPSRLVLWRTAVVLWRERPFLGIGPDNFRRRYQALLPPTSDGQPYTDTRIHANSMYFETLADLGLMGLAALAFIGCALLRVLLAHQRAGTLAGVAFGVAAATFFVHGVSDYFLEFTPLLCLFWLLLGLTAATRLEVRSS